MEEGPRLRRDPRGLSGRLLGLLTVRTVNVPPYIGFPLAAAAALAALWWFANRQLFHPMKYPAGWWGLQQELGVEDLWITAADGVRLHGWWKAVPGARLATVYLHGNAGNVTHRAGHIFAVAEAGSSILVIDYRGYGKSAGSPSESGLYADARAAYGWLREQSWSPERIVVHGESLGTAVAVDLAVRKPVAGVVLEAPFPRPATSPGPSFPSSAPCWSAPSAASRRSTACAPRYSSSTAAGTRSSRSNSAAASSTPRRSPNSSGRSPAPVTTTSSKPPARNTRPAWRASTARCSPADLLSEPPAVRPSERHVPLEAVAQLAQVRLVHPGQRDAPHLE